MNKIQKELEQAEQYMLKTYNNTNLVAISQDNVAKVEAMIKNDAAYLNAANPESGPTQNGKGGSTAYWMYKLKDYINGNHTMSYKEIITNIVIAIDKENSTHLNADGVGREEITDRIYKISVKKLVNYLKNPKGTKYELIKIIAEKTKAPEKARENISFASKFCHYACFYLFKGMTEQDNYSIYDSVVKKALPLYTKYYGIDINKNTLDDYVKYSEVIEQILEKTGNNISKNGFDHLLWYYFKGRNINDIKIECEDI